MRDNQHQARRFRSTRHTYRSFSARHRPLNHNSPMVILNRRPLFLCRLFHRSHNLSHKFSPKPSPSRHTTHHPRNTSILLLVLVPCMPKGSTVQGLTSFPIILNIRSPLRHTSLLSNSLNHHNLHLTLSKRKRCHPGLSVIHSRWHPNNEVPRHLPHNRHSI